MKDGLQIIVYAFSITASIWAFGKYIFPIIRRRIERSLYIHTTGVHVVQDIEKTFGREAGVALRRMVETLHQKIDMKDIRLDILENTLSIGIYLCDGDGKCTYANKTLADMFNMDKERMMGYGWLEPIVNKKAAYETWKFAVDNRIPYSDTYDVSTELGVRTYKTMAEPSIKDDIVLGYVGVVRIA